MLKQGDGDTDLVLKYEDNHCQWNSDKVQDRVGRTCYIQWKMYLFQILISRRPPIVHSYRKIFTMGNRLHSLPCVVVKCINIWINVTYGMPM